MKNFPKTVFMKIETPNSGVPWLNPAENIVSLVDSGERVRLGVYTLTEIIQAEGTITTKRLPAKVMPKHVRRDA